MSIADSSRRATLEIADWRRTVGHLVARLRDHRILLLAVIATMAAAGAFGLVTPRLLGSVVDLVTDGGDTGDVLTLAGWMAAAAVAAAVCAGLGIASAAAVFESVLASLREDMLEKVLGLPIARVEQVGSGDVLSRATDDVDKVGEAIGKALPSVLMSGAGVVVTVIGLAALDWRFLLVAVVTLPIYITTGKTYLRLAPPVYAQERIATANRAHHVLGPVQGLPTVRAFDLGARLSLRIDANSWAVVRRSMEAAVLRSRLFGRLNFAELVGMGVILVVGFVLVGDGTLTVGATTAAMLFFLAMFEPIGRLMHVLDDLQSGAAALGRIVGVLDEKTPDASDDGHSDDGSGLVAERISFGYTEGRLILDDVSVTIRPHEHVALVGVSGAGKSTLASVLAGVHTPTEGVARLGGVDVAAMGDGTRARRIALLTQEVHVFSGSLREDLLLGDPDADDERVWQALEKAGAAEWVRTLDDGLDTVVGDHGHEIDSMTVQQLALARIDLLDAELVIVDEATADAGSAGAGRLERAAAAVLAGRSALIIAHRLSQAAAADRVIHLESGRVIEAGSHDELVAAGGGYSEIWSAWSRGRDEL